MKNIFGTDLIIPVVFIFITGFSLMKKTDFFGDFLSGAKEGLASAADVLPALCLLMTAISMIRASGILEALTAAALPIIEKLGFPKEVLPLAVLRPFSGSGALAYYKEICESVPPDSFPARVASVLMGGSETTFYTLAVYYGAVGIKKTKNTVLASVGADIAAAVLSAFAVRIFMGC